MRHAALTRRSPGPRPAPSIARRSLAVSLVVAAASLGALDFGTLSAHLPSATEPPAAHVLAATPAAPIPGKLAPPSTLPFATKSPSGHVSPAFAIASGAGFALTAVIMMVQFVLTRPRRRGRWTL